MSEELNKYDEVEKAVDNPSEEDIRLKLRDDVAFAKEVAFHAGLKKAISDQSAFEFEAMLAEVEDRLYNSKKSNLRIVRWAISIAASIVLIIGVYTLIEWRAADPEYLFAQHFQAYQPGHTDRGAETVVTDELRAFEAYEQGNYERAIALFSNLLIEQDNPQYHLLLAISWMEQDQPDQAIPALKDILSENNTSYQVEAAWYLALAYLQMGELPEAKAQLKRVEASNSKFSPLAKQILEEL